jgi:KDO2-lipid IV(A) lauroyltransferase
MRNGSKTFTPSPPNGWAKDSCLSERILLGLGKAFSFVLYVLVRFVMRYRFTVLRKNLETSFPHKPEAEIRALITTYYRHLADLVVEPVLFTVAGHATRKKLATYANMDLLNHLYHEKKHAILLASHIGNWEYLINLPRETDYEVYTAYTPISNRHIDNWVHKMRSRFGVTVILKKNFYRKALSVLKGDGNPALVVVIADQRPAPGSVKYNLEFLGQNTSVQVGAERLAQSSNAAVLYLECTRVRQFHYQYTFHLLTEAPTACGPLEITTKYYEMMERNIASQPGNWLWSHERWKPVAG